MLVSVPVPVFMPSVCAVIRPNTSLEEEDGEERAGSFVTLIALAGGAACEEAAADVEELAMPRMCASCWGRKWWCVDVMV